MEANLFAGLLIDYFVVLGMPYQLLSLVLIITFISMFY